MHAEVQRINVDWFEGLRAFSDADMEVADVLDVGWQGIAQDILDVRTEAGRRQSRSKRLRKLRFVGYGAVALIVEFIVGELTGAHLWGAAGSALTLALLENVWVDKALERREHQLQRRELIRELTLHLLLWLDLRFLEANLSRYAAQHDVPAITLVPMRLFADPPVERH
jgi:hypothetical protein